MQKYRYDDLSFESSTTAATREHMTSLITSSSGGEKHEHDSGRPPAAAAVSSAAGRRKGEGVSMPKILDISINNWLIPVSVLLGVATGLIVPGDSELSEEYRPVSSVMGWVYFYAWTLSFYPQVFLNAVRKDTKGFNTDKLVYDFIGFGSLSVYCYAFRYIHSVRESYRDHHNGNSPTVQINDVAFAFHAFAMTLVQMGQVIRYNGFTQMPSKKCLIGSGVTIVIIFIYLIICLLVDSSVFVVLNWLYFISFVKIGVTLIKYAPQVILNHSRRSTLGWSITAVTMDFMGSTLSILQLVMDCNDMNHMAGIYGNLVKLALGVISIVFDTIFFCQHYILYGSGVSAEYKPLLTEGEDEEEEDDEEYARKGALYVNESGQLIHTASGKKVPSADLSMWEQGQQQQSGPDDSIQRLPHVLHKIPESEYPDNSPVPPPHLRTASSTSTSLWNQETQRACFGAGSFWGTQKFISEDFGKHLFADSLIEQDQVGYMVKAGRVGAERPKTLEAIKSLGCEYVEVFECTFAGGLDMYEELVKFFFRFHDCTTKDQQKNHVGPQYASVVYCFNEEQRRIALDVKSRLQRLIDKGALTCFKAKKVTTEIISAGDYCFVPAEDRHQHYLQKNPAEKCPLNIRFQQW